MANKKISLIDRLLHEGWFTNPQEATPWLLAGKVLVNTRQTFNANEKIPADASIRVKEYYKRCFVNKGGLKLHKALTHFNITVSGHTALDCGASTGGFTDCLIQHGATRVYAVDAGHGELSAKLRNHDRVINLERTNISDAILHTLDPRPTLISLDLSYLSLKKALPSCTKILQNTGEIVALIKPIVEVESVAIRQSGDINQRAVLIGVLKDMYQFFEESGFTLRGMTHSPIRGNRDALEYFAHLSFAAPGTNSEDNQRAPLNFAAIVDDSFALEKFDRNGFDPTHLPMHTQDTM
ncbi:MAG: TlyA family RNA methyltransferase [Defluviitaleaceae bacterium]|nr:TlyA family RNA methyltransferase [Defluviitaleaceae bacterium]